ncbi:RidA family protein [uncultured Draconibacterium sp.]|uniref:RidA family protein n=1 Tax=uncultured Draconibacterium sp. TaxID=1573823 RepID=UPI0025CF59F7|nr:RidA family protein [uncultured Draconibacterium sp.]
MESRNQHINPDGLFKSPAFSQIVMTQGNGKTIYIGGQNSVDQNHEIVGKNDIATQTEQVMKNLEIALKACGATFDNLVKLNINIVQGQDARMGFKVSQKYLGQNSNQPIVTVLFVAGLVNPDFLIEIDAIAFLPEQ